MSTGTAPDAIGGFEDIMASGWPVHVKRYLVGNLEIHVHIRLTREPGGCCVSFVRPRSEAVRPSGTDAGRRPQHERPVLVPFFGAAEPGGRGVARVVRIRSLERLQPLDRCPRARRHAAEFGRVVASEPPLRPEEILAATRIELAGDEVRWWVDPPVDRLLRGMEVLICSVRFRAEEAAGGREEGPP